MQQIHQSHMGRTHYFVIGPLASKVGSSWDSLNADSKRITGTGDRAASLLYAGVPEVYVLPARFSDSIIYL